jgi:peptidoglycan hydrolase-like protein with peptidoglycan-binding domain
MAEPVTETNGHPVTFRAGRGPAESALPGSADHLTAEAVLPAHAAGQKVLLADVSEFQPSISDATYLAWSPAIVIRAAYGAAHTDHAWYGGQRRALLLAGGAKFLGIYQYLVAGQDAVAQARALVSIVGGKLNKGEVIICDLEEGSGNQHGRLAAWSHVITSELGDAPWAYSGLWFAQNAGIAPVGWVAAYQNSEPAAPHTLWQFTDAFAVPGVGSTDCSVYHGTIGQLAALAHGGTAPPKPPPAGNWTDALLASLPTLSAGATGQDTRSIQGLLSGRSHPVTMDGAYGPVTRSAVMAFQHSSGLSPDGVTGPATWRKLLRSAAGTTLPTLGSGDSGDDVRTIQGLLTARGYTAAMNGAYNPQTHAAIIALQHAGGLVPDGVTGPHTWARLLNR